MQRTVLKKLKIQEAQLIGYAIESDFINRVDSSNIDGLSLFFATKRIDYFGRDKIILSILSQIPERLGHFNLILSFLFDIDQFGDMLSKPIRLFLKILDYYAYDIVINGTSKRFWIHSYIESMAAVMEDMKKYNKGLRGKPEDVFMFMIGKPGKFSEQVNFLFGIDYNKYISDLRQDMV